MYAADGRRSVTHTTSTPRCYPRFQALSGVIKCGGDDWNRPIQRVHLLSCGRRSEAPQPIAGQALRPFKQLVDRSCRQSSTTLPSHLPTNAHTSKKTAPWNRQRRPKRPASLNRAAAGQPSYLARYERPREAHGRAATRRTTVPGRARCGRRPAPLPPARSRR